MGITPFISMIKDHLHLNKQQNITLLYCSKTTEDIIFKKELDEINERWLKKTFMLSKEKEFFKDWEMGHINKQIIEKNAGDIENSLNCAMEYREFSNRHSPKQDDLTKGNVYIKNSLFYICGPEAMKEEIIKILRHMGVKKENIKIESFFW